MPRFANVSLAVIATVLVGQVIVDRFVPAVALHFTKGRYGAAVTECERARDAARATASGLTGDRQTDTELQNSVSVQMLGCLDQEMLKNELLSWGVRQSSLRSVELSVMSRTADIRYDGARMLSQ
jgi:hypothetical protein